VRALQFLGAGEAESDCLDLIVRRGHEVDAVRALSERLIDCGRALALMRMRPSGATAALVEHMRQRGWRVWQEPQETCPFVSLRGRSFEPYLAGLGPEHRCAFRRKLGRIEHRHTTHYELTRTEAQRRDAIATLFRLHELRWRPRGDAGAFATQALRDFHDEISKVALAAGWLRLWTLRLDGMAAAAVYGFLYRRTFYFYQSGFDPELARESVDMVLLGVAVRAAIEQGADELALLHQTEHHEARSASATRELLRFELYGPGTRGLLEREATALTRQARRVTRLALEMGRRAFAGARAVDHAEPG
jgi:CelD/BcsL family acetyltransferase involved in cellulose biosynthesis